MGKKDSTESAFKEKYKERYRLRCKNGITKPVAERWLRFIFDDKLITIGSDKECQKFILMFKNDVNEKLYSKLKKDFADIFELYKKEK